MAELKARKAELIALGEAIPSQRSYYLVYPARNETLPSLVAFREWLLSGGSGVDG